MDEPVKKVIPFPRSADPIAAGEPISASSAETLSILRNFLNINDPAVQQAVAELVAAIARASGS
jgi:hypothetical protein